MPRFNRNAGFFNADGASGVPFAGADTGGVVPPGGGGGGGGFPGAGGGFPGGGGGGSGFVGGPNAGGLGRRGFASQNDPTLPDNLLGRYGPTERLNLWTHRGNAVDGGWAMITVDRPTMLRPVSQLAGEVLYAPHSRLVDVGSITAKLAAMRASGPGNVYLWAPGAWWVFYDAPTPANFVQFGAEDPGIVAAALSEPGCQKAVFGSFTPTAANIAELVLPANPHRRSLTITVAPTNTQYAIGFTNAVSISPPVGLILTGVGGSITFERESLHRGEIWASAQLTTGALTFVELT